MVEQKLLLDTLHQVWVLLQVGAGIVPALTDTFTVHGKPCAALLNDVQVGGEIDDLPRTANAMTVQDIELYFTEGRGKLVLDHLHARAVTDGYWVFTGSNALFDGSDAANVQALGGVELEGVATSRGLGATKHDTDLHADLVGEHDDTVRAVHGARDFAQCLAHEASL